MLRLSNQKHLFWRTNIFWLKKTRESKEGGLFFNVAVTVAIFWALEQVLLQTPFNKYISKLGELQLILYPLLLPEAIITACASPVIYLEEKL